MKAITPHLQISRQALVLEIGSGHRPHPRADILTDKYIEDIERGGRLVTDRPFVQADAEQLPFKSDVFDYVICRQVLEHLEAPESFFNEIGRIGQGGYIEAPSAIWEHLHPIRSYHRWYVMDIDSKILMMRKTDQSKPIFGQLFETLNRYSPEYRLFIRKYADLFYVRHRWHGSVNYCIGSTDEYSAWFLEPWDTDMVKRFVPRRTMSLQALDLIVGALRSVWNGMWRRWGTLRPVSWHQVDLASLMQCPVCQNQNIIIVDDRAVCSSCDWFTKVFVPA